LLTVIRAAQGRDADAAAGLAELRPAAERLSMFAHGAERWPDLIAVLGTYERPALAAPALALAGAMNQSLDRVMKVFMRVDDQEWWVAAARDARARVEVASKPAKDRRPFGSDPDLAHWAPATDSTGVLGRIAGVPHWSVENGAIIHRPGRGNDDLIFRSPIRGDFEVTCELRLGGWREARIAYGGFQFELDADRKKYRTKMMLSDPGRHLTITPALPAASGDTYQFKLVVKDGWCRAFADGRELVAERTGDMGDPWLTIRCGHEYTGEVRNLKITGKPVVPAAIDLLDGEDLPFWQQQAGFGLGWAKRGEELYHAGKEPEPPADGKPLPPRVFPEAANYYHRPFLEDGIATYEFYYDPGKAFVHPALDRLVFLLDPEGVKLHRLTSGALERGGLAFDNATEEPKNRRGPSKLPLKPKAWNAVRLEVKGDTLLVSLNGELVYERPIEPINQRTFGLFHYTDRTEVRVRRVSLTGDWPKKLPAEGDLFEGRASGNR
jgi:hypothetical protein